MVEDWREKSDQDLNVGAVLTDFSRDFDCFPHYLFIAKLAGYGFDDSSLWLLYSYRKNLKTMCSYA